MTNKEKTQLQKELLDSLPLKPHGRLLLAPRMGKTKLVIDLIKKNNPKSILWVTPTAKLAEEDIPAEFVTWKAKRFLNRLRTVTWTSLNKIEGHYEMIVLDEEQFATKNNMQTLLDGALSYDYIISMTGTRTYHEDKKELYKALNLKVLFEVDINDAVDMGVLSNYEINIVEVMMSKEKNIEAGSKDKKFLTSEENQYRYLDKMAMQAIFQKRRDLAFRLTQRMRAVYDSPSKNEVAEFLMKHLPGRKIFFCSSQAQAERLSPNFYHGTSDNTALQKFVAGEVNEIAMVNKGGTGYTYKEIDHLVLVQADSDKNGLTTQKICRTLLAQKDYKATIWIICLLGTQDEKWIESALERFDKSKVNYINFKNLKNEKSDI